MKEKFTKINTIALTKETKSPENPEALEKRVALIPEHLKSLVEKGFKVFVEVGSGEGIGYSDLEYQNAGATLQSSEDIYKNKDMVIKFKGPSLKNISKMTSGSIFFAWPILNLSKKELNYYKNVELTSLPWKRFWNHPSLYPMKS